MSGVNGVGGQMSIDRIMAMRSQILERNQALARANAAANAGTPAITTTTAAPSGVSSFSDSLNQALQSVNQSQSNASELSASYERGETIDIAKVMLARQEASVSFEATLQVRNKLLSAYKDVMSMSV